MNCCVCNTAFLPYETYLLDSWGNRFHEYHKEEKKCGSCGCIAFGNTLNLTDGRTICIHCKNEAIISEDAMCKCYDAVIKFYQMGNIQVPLEKIELRLNNVHKQPSGTRGHVFSYPKISYKIDMLKGLNKTIFCGVLAHELMHVVIYEKGLNTQLNKKESEGLCELSAFFAYRLFNTPTVTPTATVAIKQLENNKDPVYGDGFRMMRDRVKKVGSLQKYLGILMKKK